MGFVLYVFCVGHVLWVLPFTPASSELLAIKAIKFGVFRAQSASYWHSRGLSQVLLMLMMGRAAARERLPMLQ